MCKTDPIDYVEDLLGRPLFKMGFLDFFRNMQEQGFDAAKSCWDSSYGGDFFIPNATKLFEKLIDFYIILGFVPFTRYEKLLDENAQLKDENNILRNAVGELKSTNLPSLANDVQEPWQGPARKQTSELLH